MELFKRFLLPVSMLILAAGFWFYPNFEQIAAGIAVFLFGLKMLERGIQGLSGGLLESMLQKVTSSTPRAMLFGLTTTTLVQSSTLVMVLAISFLSAGMIPLGTGIGVVFGANLGTTTGTWLIGGLGLSISLTKIALPIIIFGVLLLFQTRPIYQAFGNMLLGMGFLFLGIDYIKIGFAGVQDSFDFSILSANNFFDILLLFGLGFFITVVLQSSHATLLLTLSALAANHISFTSSAAITVGACVGTTIIPLLSSLGANEAGKRLALTHFMFNLSSAILVLPALPLLLWLVEEAAHFVGVPSDFYPLKLAIFHSFFSLIGIIIMWPQKERLQLWLQKIIPTVEPKTARVKYLTPSALESTATAVTVARSETLRLYNIANNIIIEGLGWYVEEFEQEWPLDQLSEANKNQPLPNLQYLYEQNIKVIYSEIIGFISSAREKSTDLHDDQLRELWAANFHLVEAIKSIKHLQRNMGLYLHHKNQDISQTYQNMRLQLGEVLRANAFAQGTADPTESRLLLDHQLLLTERVQSESNGLIEGLIRSRKITTGMATSLMADKGYVYKACLSLINTGRYLFIDPEKPQAQTPESLELETADLSDINQMLDDQRSEEAMEQ